MSEKCGKECEVYSRIVGYFRPVQNWNVGKKEEFGQRTAFVHSEETPEECCVPEAVSEKIKA